MGRPPKARGGAWWEDGHGGGLGNLVIEVDAGLVSGLKTIKSLSVEKIKSRIEPETRYPKPRQRGSSRA
jgi:hypothetical protein